MTDIISNMDVGFAVLLCIAAVILTHGFENGWFDKKADRKEDGVTDKTEEKESEK